MSNQPPLNPLPLPPRWKDQGVISRELWIGLVVKKVNLRMTVDYLNDYMQQSEPELRERGYAWQTAIGLQAVDGLKPSSYLLETARRDIEGEIDGSEAARLLRGYYKQRDVRTAQERGEREADLAAANIRMLLGERSVAFSVVGFAGVHRRIFEGVFGHAGKFRTYNITKNEWILRGDSVVYAPYTELGPSIEYEIDREKNFDYSALNRRQIVEHLAEFIASLWQIHPFCEGNTRATAVFAILYLRSLGFDATNDLFARHSWYFRNALVRANYRNAAKGVVRDSSYLQRFIANLLLGEQNELHNRTMLIGTQQLAPTLDPTSTQQVPNNLADLPAPITDIVKAIGQQTLSVKEIMSVMGLKDRVNFMYNYLAPAIERQFVCPLYPDKPRHPRQRYSLTVRGLMLLG